MEYTPLNIQAMNLAERLPEEVGSLAEAAIVRRLRAMDFKVKAGLLCLAIDGLDLPLTIPRVSVLVFGTEQVRAIDYFRRVLERGDMVDAVVMPRQGNGFPMRSFWIRIEYADMRSATGSFSKKDDGLFAMRAKAGEKAERVVARQLRDQFGHSFPTAMLDSPGFFEIRYKAKKLRQPDRKCLACGLTFEVKKRNRDQHLRVSHSEGRPFATENIPEGWHAFVFADMKARFVSNSAIAQAIQGRQYEPGEDQYDRWAQINPGAITLSDPPHCPGPAQAG